MVQVNFVVDCSGSMGATGATWKGNKYARYEIVKTALNICVAHMQKPDRVQIVEFESNANTLVESTSDYTGAMISLSDPSALHPRGGTNIPAGLKEALKGASNSTKNITILITDMWDAEMANLPMGWPKSPKGGYISRSFNEDCGNGDSCFKALADLGPVYVIIIGDKGQKAQMEQACKNLSKVVSQDYGIKWNDCYAAAMGRRSSKSAIDLTQYLTSIGPFYKNEE
jgi:hypothetical protein